MNLHNESHIQDLLDVWNHHQDLRRSGASIAELSDSRTRLDTVRSELY